MQLKKLFNFSIKLTIFQLLTLLAAEPGVFAKNVGGDSSKSSSIKKNHVPVIWSVPYTTQLFVGRQGYIRKLRGQLQSKSMATVVAMGGVGKSSVARQYANRYRGNYDIVVWINAQVDINLQLESLAEQYAAFVDKTTQKDFQSYSLKRKLSYIRNKLRTKPHRFLLIFDNAEEYQKIKPHLVFCQHPKGVGHVLVTTRSSVQWPYQLRLKMFTTKEAQGLIAKVTGSKDEKLVAKLAEQLKNYPLAIARAVAYIKASNSFDLASYIKAFESQRSELLQRTGEVKGLLNDYYRTSYTVLSLALNAIKQNSIEAWHLLLCLSLLKNINIPMDYIKEWVKQFAKDSAVENLLAVIQNQSILEKNGQFFNIHELTGEIIRKHIPKGKKGKYLEQSIKVLLSAFNGRADLVVAKIIKERHHLEHAEEVVKRLKKNKPGDIKAAIALKTAMLECYYIGLKNKKRSLELVKDLDKYFGKEKTKWFGTLYEPSKVEAMFLNCKGRMLTVAAKYDQAAIYRKKALDIFMIINDPTQEKLKPIVGLVAGLTLSGDLKEAKKYIDIGDEYFNFCPSIWVRYNFVRSKLGYSIAKGDQALITKELEMAEMYYEKIIDYPTSQMYLLATIIRALYCLKRYNEMPKFLDILDKKLKLFFGNEIPDFYPAGALKLCWGLYYIKQGQKHYTKAEALINEALKIFRKGYGGEGKVVSQAIAHMAIGQIYLNLNRDKADSHKSFHSYQKAKKIFDKVLKYKDNDYYSQLYCQMVKVGAINDHFGITVENYVKHMERFGGDHPRTIEMILFLDAQDKPLPK